MDIFEKVRNLIASQLAKPIEKITPDCKIIDDLGADSLDVVEMLMSLEDVFGLTIPDEVATSIVTVKDIVDYIESSKN